MSGRARGGGFNCAVHGHEIPVWSVTTGELRVVRIDRTRVPTPRRRHDRAATDHNDKSRQHVAPAVSTDEPTPEIDETSTWPELAIGLYERLTGRGAEITYEFDDMEVEVPSKVGDDADHAHWKLNGTMRISTREPGNE
jgi:hypothetical protein